MPNGFILDFDIPNIKMEYLPKDIHDDYDFIKLIEYVAEYIDCIYVHLFDFKYTNG